MLANERSPARIPDVPTAGNVGVAGVALQAQLFIASGILLVLVLGLCLAQRRQRRELASMRQALESEQQQTQLLQETVRTMGRQLVELEHRINRLATGEAGPAASTGPAASAAKMDMEEILSQLDQGKTAEQLAQETGLDEVEISLLQEIRTQREPEPQP